MPKVRAGEAIEEPRGELRCAPFMCDARNLRPPDRNAATPVVTAVGDTALEPVTSALSWQDDPDRGGQLRLW